MYILGISCYYHDSAATLVKDGIVVAAVEEERFSRKKHDQSFPYKSIEYCLKSQNININDISYIGFYEKPILKFERFLYQQLDSFPLGLKPFLSSVPSWILEKGRVKSTIRNKLKYKGEIFFIDHHLSHAASAFLVSPFKNATIVTVDGVGEYTTTAYGNGVDEQIELLKEIRFPSSIGLLYSTITAYLGFTVNNSEYKVMGLSAYGNMDRRKNKYYEELNKVLDLKEDGSYRMNMEYFTYLYDNKMPSKKLCALLGGEPRKKTEPLDQRHKDIAAALQLITEDIMTKILNHAYNTTKCENLVMAGGVALNSVYNGKILRTTPFKKIWIQQNSSDGGTSMGVAIYIYNTILNNKRKYVLESPYLGPRFDENEIIRFLKEKGIIYSKFKNEKELVETTAQLIYENNVVGWFQGGMEWGPRALGARSILSNPCTQNMQEILNLKVKHREKFRPFAPVVCEDDATKYFECDEPVPQPTDFMLMVYPIKKEWHKKIPSVTHVDGSGRLQTIRRKQNPVYYDTIKEFGKLSGIPILINTSFNIRGEPIVCTPMDAYRCMMGTGIDFLIMEKFLIKREDNPKDMWDIEKYAYD